MYQWACLFVCLHMYMCLMNVEIEKKKIVDLSTNSIRQTDFADRRVCLYLCEPFGNFLSQEFALHFSFLVAIDFRPR